MQWLFPLPTPHARTMTAVGLAFLLAGCASSGTRDDAGEGTSPLLGGTATTSLDGEYEIPSSLHATGILPLGLWGGCLSDSCPQYRFDLSGNTTVELRLEWNLPVNDIDVLVFDARQEIVMEGVNGAPQTGELARATLPAGWYIITIFPFQAATDEYTLTVEFGRP